MLAVMRLDIYLAAKGETVETVARRCNLSTARIAADNGLTTIAPLAQGQALTIRKVQKNHVVRRGETVESIAAQHGISVRALYRANPQLHGLPPLVTGQPLAVKMVDTPRLPLQVLGTVSPHPSVFSLRAVLPFLTYVAPFAYPIAPNGGLPLTDTSFLQNTALDYGVLPLAFTQGSIPPNAVNRFIQTARFAAPYGLVTATAPHPFLQKHFEAENKLCFTVFPPISHHGIDRKKGAPPVLLSQKQLYACAVRHTAVIRFDDTAKQPYFQYRDATQTPHTVWFHDPRSWHIQLQKLPCVTVADACHATPLFAVLTACRHLVE